MMFTFRQFLRAHLATALLAASAGTVIAQADLVLSKEPDPPGITNIRAGDLLNYRISATNDGPDPANNVEIVDVAVQMLEDFSPSEGASCMQEPVGVGFAGRITCNWAGSTGVGESRFIDIQVRPCAGAPCNSFLTLDEGEASSSTFDPNSDNNQQTEAGGTVPALELEVFQQSEFDTTVETDSDTVELGDQLAYRIAVANEGPSTAEEVTVAHVLPDGWEVDAIMTESGFPADCSGVGTGTATCSFALQTTNICAAFAPMEETVVVLANVPSDGIPGDVEAVTEVGSTNCLEDLGDTRVVTRNGVIGPFELHFAQFGGGAGFTSDIVLTNPSPTDMVAGTINFFLRTGMPMEIDLTNDETPGPVSSVDFMIEPNGGVRLTTSSEGELQTGSASLTATDFIGGVVRFTSPVGIVGVGGAEPLFGAIIPVRNQAGIQTGIAIRNLLADANQFFALSLRTFEGVEVTDGAGALNLQPNAQTASFLGGLFPEADLENFEGVLVIEASDTFAATALEQGANPGEFTALPVTPVEPVILIEDN